MFYHFDLSEAGAIFSSDEFKHSYFQAGVWE